MIGFAGSKVKLKCYSGWGDVYKWDVIFYYQSVGTETQFRVASVTMEHPLRKCWYWMALPCLCVRMYGLNIL